MSEGNKRDFRIFVDVGSENFQLKLPQKDLARELLIYAGEIKNKTNKQK